MRRLSLTSTGFAPFAYTKLIVLWARGIYCSLVQFWYRGRCPLQPTHNRLLGARSTRRLRPYLHPHFTFAALLPASPQFGQARERITPSLPSRATTPMNQSPNKPFNRSTNPPGSSCLPVPAYRRQAQAGGGAEMRALVLNHWEHKQVQWIVSVVTR